MKVLTVASPWMGGSGTVGFQVAKYLEKFDVESHFLSYDHPFRHDPVNNDALRFGNVEPFEYPLFPFPIYELALAEKIAEHVLVHDIDIIHAHYGILFGHAALLAKQAVAAQNKNVKLVLTNHGSDVLGFDLSNPGSVAPTHLNTLLIKQSDAVTFVSHDLKQWSEKLYGKNAQSFVIPNSVDTSVFSPGTETEPSGPLNLIHISNFRPVKRPVFVIDTFAEILKENPEAFLHMVGDGPEMNLVVDRISELGIQESISLTGKMSEAELVSLLQKQDILIQPSQYESFSLVALEALACGVSVVASDVGGLSEVVRSGESGLLINIEAGPSDFAAQVLNAYSDPAQRRIAKSKAREQSLLFSQEKIMQQYLALYQQVLE